MSLTLFFQKRYSTALHLFWKNKYGENNIFLTLWNDYSKMYLSKIDHKKTICSAWRAGVSDGIRPDQKNFKLSLVKWWKKIPIILFSYIPRRFYQQQKINMSLSRLFIQAFFSIQSSHQFIHFLLLY